MQQQLFDHKDRQRARLTEQRELLKEARGSKDSAMAADLDKKDIDFVASTRVNLSQKELL